MNQLAANAAFCFTVPGPKMIWQFGELGYDETLGEEDEKKQQRSRYIGNIMMNLHAKVCMMYMLNY